MSISKRYYPILVAALLLLIVASRMPGLATRELEVEDVWSIWQTFGTANQIVQWTPYDWPPLYYLTLGAWRSLVGIHPLATRMLTVLVFILGVALTARLAARLAGKHGEPAALLAIATLGSFSFGLYVSLLLRGYVFVMALVPLALLLTDAYFKRPTVPRALALAVCMAAMFYTHLTAVFAYVVLAAWSLLYYRRTFWRWWLPGLLAVLLAMPELIAKLQLTVWRAGARSAVMAQIGEPSLPGALAKLYTDLVGNTIPAWWILFFAATVLIFVATSRFRQQRRQISLLVFWMFVPVIAYFLDRFVGSFTPRHLAWVMVGMSIWVGWGLAHLPKRGVAVALVSLIVLISQASPEAYWYFRSPFMITFPGLARDMQAGDVILVDPKCNTGSPEEWDYFTQLFFPNGLKFVTSPDGYRRVWYLKIDGNSDPATDQAVRRNRIEGEFIGPWNFLFRLYEAPPDLVGKLFENNMRFHGADVLGRTPTKDSTYRVGETLRLRLWWSVDNDRQPALDYSVGVYLLDQGRLVAQSDGAPQPLDGPRETSRWLPGRYYVEERSLTLPDSLRTGSYPLLMAVYYFMDGKRVAGPGVNAENLLPLLSIQVKSWVSGS